MQQAHTRVHHRRSSGRPSTERRDGDAGRPPGSSRRWEMTAARTAPPPLPRARRSSTGGHCGAEGKEKRMRQRHRHRSRCSICQGAGGDRGAADLELGHWESGRESSPVGRPRRAARRLELPVRSQNEMERVLNGNRGWGGGGRTPLNRARLPKIKTSADI